MNFKHRIRKLRGEMSQSEFSQLVGINPNTLRNYEQGQSLPNISTAAELCKKTGVLVEWLILGEGPMRRGEEALSTPARSTISMDNQTLEKELASERDLNRELLMENRELNAENRQLIKENANLRVELERAKARAAPSEEQEGTRKSA
jgi:transcriptional regulator with XRE-family HTH domain